MSLNRVIGKGNALPWHLPEDFKWFKEKTMGNTIVMGRKTFESLKKPLPGRTHVVLSHKSNPLKGAILIHSLEELETLDTLGDVYICGGSQIYEQALGRCSELFLTRVKRIVEGDAYFPPFEHLFDVEAVEVLRETEDFCVEYYTRKIV